MGALLGRWGWQWLLLAVVALAGARGMANGRSPGQAPVSRLSQGQAAGQFLRAVLRADYATAYGRLAPEVRRAISSGRFAAAVRPLWKAGQRRHSPEIELYKLGMRLSDGGASRLFYAFAFVTDSCLKTPHVLLEVTFRDTAARVILGFDVRQGRVAPTRARN